MDLPREVEDFLLACKAKIRPLSPEAPYLEHRPHLTIFVSRDPSPAEAAAAISEEATQALADPAGRTLRFHGWRLFENDSLAAGGTTVVLDTQLTPALALAQLTIAEAWRKFRVGPEGPDPGASDPLLEVFAPGPARYSLQRYGWPFVGPHWLPHATVAAIPGDASEEARAVLPELLAMPTPKEAYVRTVELARVKGDEHETLATLAWE